MMKSVIDIDTKIIEKAVVKYGIQMQSMVQRSCLNGFVSGTMWASSPTRTKSRAGHARLVDMEECAELTKAISKLIRGSGSRTGLLEEMADVAICLKQLQLMYNIPDDDLRLTIDQKLDRLEGRMNL